MERSVEVRVQAGESRCGLVVLWHTRDINMKATISKNELPRHTEQEGTPGPSDFELVL